MPPNDVLVKRQRVDADADDDSNDSDDEGDSDDGEEEEVEDDEEKKEDVVKEMSEAVQVHGSDSVNSHIRASDRNSDDRVSANQLLSESVSKGESQDTADADPDMTKGQGQVQISNVASDKVSGHATVDGSSVESGSQRGNSFAEGSSMEGDSVQGSIIDGSISDSFVVGGEGGEEGGGEDNMALIARRVALSVDDAKRGQEKDRDGSLATAEARGINGSGSGGGGGGIGRGRVAGNEGKTRKFVRIDESANISTTLPELPPESPDKSITIEDTESRSVSVDTNRGNSGNTGSSESMHKNDSSGDAAAATGAWFVPRSKTKPQWLPQTVVADALEGPEFEAGMSFILLAVLYSSIRCTLVFSFSACTVMFCNALTKLVVTLKTAFSLSRSEVIRRTVIEAEELEALASSEVAVKEEIRTYSLPPHQKQAVTQYPGVPERYFHYLRRTELKKQTVDFDLASQVSIQQTSGATQTLTPPDVEFVSKIREERRKKVMSEAALDTGGFDPPVSHPLINNGRFGPDVEELSMPLPEYFPKFAGIAGPALAGQLKVHAIRYLSTPFVASPWRIYVTYKEFTYYI